MAVKLTINGDGLTFEKEIEMFQATQIMGFIAKSEVLTTNVSQDNVAPLMDTSAPVQPVMLVDETEKKYESPRQAIDTLKAKTNPHKLVAIGLYLGATSQNSRILTHAEILSEFSKAGEPTPKNFPRDVNNAVADGYVYPESKTTFRLLSSTDNLAETGFKKSRARSSGSKQTSGPRAKLEVRPEVDTLPIETTIEGLKGFFEVKDRSDKIMWILKYAENNGVIGLNRKEIFHLSAKLGGDLDSQNFTNAHRPNIKNGYVMQQGEIIGISARGKQYIPDGLKPDES